MNQFKPGYQYRAGDRISGIYHGVAYSGTVREARRHTIRLEMTEVHVDLDAAIVVYSDPRLSIIVAILDDGSEV
jgi:hypothetical protein